ncbi:hypothetical protein PWT90_07139 [Aphanocladium album]|nr:hypothetical protein PWT90_07139 [Aphanocladium album]
MHILSLLTLASAASAASEASAASAEPDEPTLPFSDPNCTYTDLLGRCVDTPYALHMGYLLRNATYAAACYTAHTAAAASLAVARRSRGYRKHVLGKNKGFDDEIRRREAEWRGAWRNMTSTAADAVLAVRSELDAATGHLRRLRGQAPGLAQLAEGQLLDAQAVLGLAVDKWTRNAHALQKTSRRMARKRNRLPAGVDRRERRVASGVVFAAQKVALADAQREEAAWKLWVAFRDEVAQAEYERVYVYDELKGGEVMN